MVDGYSVTVPPQVIIQNVDTPDDLRALDSDIQVDGSPAFISASPGGFYRWDAASLSADDGNSVIRPDDRTSLQAGRWIIVSSLSYGTSLGFVLYTDLTSVSGTLVGQIAAVFGDSGTHVDPVSGDTVSNNGLYSWTGSVWQWVAVLGGLSDVPLAYNLGAVTVSTPATDLQQEWNNAAVDFVGERRRVTATAYGANSVAYSYEVDGNRIVSWTPRGDFRIGSYSTGSSESGAVVSRNLFDGLTGNVHGFNHADLIRRGGNMANASFDASPTYQSNNYDHHAGLQDRPVFQFANGAQRVSNIYGAYLKTTIDTGGATNRYGIYVEAPLLTSGASITTQYAYYTESLTTAANNWAYYSSGPAASKFGGTLTLGEYGGGTQDYGLVVTRNMQDGTFNAGHGMVVADYFRRAGNVAYASFDSIPIMAGNTYDHLANFQSRGIIQFANSGQSMASWYGLYSKGAVDTGTITNFYHAYAADPTKTGGATITTHYGFYAEALTQGTNNFSVFTAGTTPSFFGGRVALCGNIAVPAGGSVSARVPLGTGGPGILFGSGAPTVSAIKGSLYLRSDGSTTNDRAYINTDGGTTWTALITAA